MLLPFNIPPSAFDQGLEISFAQLDAFEDQGLSEDNFGWMDQTSPNTCRILDNFFQRVK